MNLLYVHRERVQRPDHPVAAESPILNLAEVAVPPGFLDCRHVVLVPRMLALDDTPYNREGKEQADEHLEGIHQCVRVHRAVEHEDASSAVNCKLEAGVALCATVSLDRALGAEASLGVRKGAVRVACRALICRHTLEDAHEAVVRYQEVAPCRALHPTVADGTIRSHLWAACGLQALGRLEFPLAVQDRRHTTSLRFGCVQDRVGIRQNRGFVLGCLLQKLVRRLGINAS
mmetsp:Transcript_105599/g.340325  ORF Transcript_105599/g.340325 Transcript_105599/m.340325 type:complete len:231 (-) Transcript_105599:392-1084(-)